MISKRLIASYVLDWIVIIAIAAIGGGLNYVPPKHRAFSLLDLSISFPLVAESISTTTLVLVCLVAPAIIIAAIALLLIPGRRFAVSTNRSQLLRTKLWELQIGLAGLCLSLATAFFVTQGMKNIFGKPRPSLLARCQPDLRNIAAHVVGGFGQDLSSRWTLVDSGICTQTNSATLHDGFRSFPSGHSSWSWSGLLYLSLFLCSKFAITIPYLPLVQSAPTTEPHMSSRSDVLPRHHRYDSVSAADETARNGESSSAEMTESTAPSQLVSFANAGAAPPNYLIVPAFIPIAVAIYICSTRYAEYYHFGFDIISGSLIGIVSAWFSFRWYHLPISRGRGWAWGPRSRDRAFAIGVGTQGYVGNEGWRTKNTGKERGLNEV